jgi:hypothetical protein
VKVRRSSWLFYPALAADRTGMMQLLAVAEAAHRPILVLVLCAPEFDRFGADPDFTALKIRVR